MNAPSKSSRTEDRLAQLRHQMRVSKVDLTVLGPTGHLRWLAGIDPHGDERPVMLFVSQTYAGLLVPALNAQSVRQHTTLPFHCWRDDEGPQAALDDLLAKLAIERNDLSLSLDEGMRADFAMLVLAALPQARHQFTAATISPLRASKDEGDYQALKASAVLNDRAVRAGFAALREGITEAEVAEVITAEYLAAGARAEFTSVCFGANSAFCHHHTGPTRLTRDCAVLIDAGARHMGFPSDMTRVGWFGTPSAEFQKVAQVVEDAVAAALAAASIGQPISAVDKAARNVITKAGYGGQFLHRTGHGLGIEIHEEPYVTAVNGRPLAEGNVFTIEPGIYLDGKFGVRLEEVIFMRPDGAEILSEMPRHPVICR
ncbi:MAG: Xaa-Pro peptidase family protein [Paracoccaceae bacterium]